MPRRRSGKKIDFVHWSGFQDSFNAQAAGSIGKNIFAAAHEPETLMRLRGTLLAYLDTTQAPGVQIAVGIGMILVPEGTGTTVLWSPLTDPDAPWFWYTAFALGYEEYVTDVISSQVASGYREVIDSKAMRITRNQEVQAVVENVTTGSAGAFNMVIAGRSLSGT